MTEPVEPVELSAVDLTTEDRAVIALAALVGVGLALALIWTLAELLRRSFGPEVES